MLTTTLSDLGAWNWIVLGLILLVFEVFLWEWPEVVSS